MRTEILLHRWLSEDLVLDERVYPAGARMDPHTDGIVRFSIVLEGSLVETGPRGEAPSSPFRVFVKAPGSRHANRFGSRGARVFSVLSPSGAALGDVAYAQLDTREAVRAMLAVRDAMSKGDALRRALQDLRDAVSRFGMEDRARAALPGWWRDVEGLFSRAAIRGESVVALAERVGVHPAHLNRLTRRAYGRSTCAQLRRLRALRAAELMAGGGHSAASAAAEAGFTDQAHLCRVFRSEIGITPGAYQRSIAAR